MNLGKSKINGCVFLIETSYLTQDTYFCLYSVFPTYGVICIIELKTYEFCVYESSVKRF